MQIRTVLAVEAAKLPQTTGRSRWEALVTALKTAPGNTWLAVPLVDLPGLDIDHKRKRVHQAVHGKGIGSIQTHPGEREMYVRVVTPYKPRSTKANKS